MHTIQVFGVAEESKNLESLLCGKLPDGVRISPQHEPNSVDMDPATLTLIITATQEVLVAVIAAVGAVWAAKVVAGANKTNDKPTPATVPKKVPAIEIETFSNSYVVVVDDHFEPSLRQVLPNNPRSVLNIRLRYQDKP